MKQALKALIHEMEYVLYCINADKVPFDGDDFHEALRLGKEALAQSEQEPAVLRFNEWAVRKNDLSDYICVGELTLAGIEDNLEGPEFGEVEIERFDDVIDALQEKLVTGRECKRVPLIAYIGANNTTPPQRTWVGLDNDDLIWIYSNSDKVGQAIANTEAKPKEKNT